MPTHSVLPKILRALRSLNPTTFLVDTPNPGAQIITDRDDKHYIIDINTFNSMDANFYNIPTERVPDALSLMAGGNTARVAAMALPVPDNIGRPFTPLADIAVVIDGVRLVTLLRSLKHRFSIEKNIGRNNLSYVLVQQSDDGMACHAVTTNGHGLIAHTVVGVEPIIAADVLYATAISNEMCDCIGAIMALATPLEMQIDIESNFELTFFSTEGDTITIRSALRSSAVRGFPTWRAVMPAPEEESEDASQYVQLIRTMGSLKKHLKGAEVTSLSVLAERAAALICVGDDDAEVRHVIGLADECTPSEFAFLVNAAGETPDLIRNVQHLSTEYMMIAARMLAELYPENAATVGCTTRSLKPLVLTAHNEEQYASATLLIMPRRRSDAMTFTQGLYGITLN